MRVDHLILQGHKDLLRAPRRCLLVSRTARQPVPNTPWVQAVVAAVRTASQAGEVLVTGAGREPFDLALHVCAQAGGACIVVLEAAPELCVHWSETRTILPANHLLAWPIEGSASPLFERDHQMALLADRATSIQVRKGGHMEGLATELRQRNVTIASGPVYAPPPQMRSPIKPARRTESQPAFVPDPALRLDGAYLCHFTREPDGPWPGESYVEYLGWLAGGTSVEAGNVAERAGPRDAAQTLARILRMRRLLASGRLMPAKTPLVSFSARTPHELLERIAWRRGLRRWTFRPYGLAVRQSALEALGARPVRYLSPSELKTLPADARLFGQKHQPPGCDWSGEAEWRLRGDLDLSTLRPGDFLALVPTPEEARAFEREFGVKTLALGIPSARA